MTSNFIVRTRADLRKAVGAMRAAGGRVALVPTMGALHEGHLSLVQLAREHADHVVASLFVNPAQFSPTEDFTAYPRRETRDAELLRGAGCKLLYAPPTDEIYPAGFATTVTVEALSEGMEGAIRPHHFAGVATVVAKLLIQATPDVAVFGEKDYQQLQVIRRLAMDLDLPIEIIGAPIVRAPDGLALSSRNAYLTRDQRRVAPALHQALTAAAQAIAAGEPAGAVEARSAASLLAAGFDAVDYFEVRDAATLARLDRGPARVEGRLLAAARLGSTRLLDNMSVVPWP